MNNALIVELNTEEVIDPRRVEALRERDSELVRMIEAIDALLKSNEWSTLKELEFDKTVATLEANLANEATKSEISAPTIYRLQGELKWARKFSKLENLSDQYRKELNGIRKVVRGDGVR